MSIVKVTILFLVFINQSYSQSDSINTGCINSRDFGDTEICLPEIDGMRECYEIPEVKLRADKSENEGNSILGFYIKENLYDKLDNFDNLNLDEYMKIYVVNNQKNKKFGLNELDEIAAILGNNFIEENWDKMKNEIDKKNSEITIGKPILIESYSPNEKTKSYLFLTKMTSEEEDHIILMTMNVILIKERIIWMAYYTQYKDDTSVDYIKSINDWNVGLFIEVN